MHTKFGFLSYEISQSIRQHFNREVQKQGLTHAQWRVLVHLSENEHCRQIDLAEILQVKPITLARQIDQLERMGLVCRNKDADDRRAHRLHITEQARPVIQTLWQIADSVELKFLGALSEDEQHVLMELLQRMKAFRQQAC